MVKTRFIAAFLTALILLMSACAQSLQPASESSEVKVFQQKADLLWTQVEADWDKDNLFPAKKVGNAVFFSVSDGTSRANVCHGTGKSLKAAWNAAVKETASFLYENPKDIIWVKADIVSSSNLISIAQLSEKLLESRPQQFYQGLSFDKTFNVALIESELNSAIIYDYYNGAANMQKLNSYLESAGRKQLEVYPENFVSFQCRSWFCDENDEIYELIAEGDHSGRRKVENFDADYTKEIITKASSYLAQQVQEDGSFIYHYYPRFDEIPKDYNIIRHAGTIWAMIQSYQISPDETLAESIRKAIEYMITQTIYDEEGRAFLYDNVDDEVGLGGGALAVLALTEYAEVFQDDEYLDLCIAFGEGILSLQDPSSGEYYHILSKDLERTEPYRTVYYDGEAAFALCRLYGLTEDVRWLEAAELTADHFIDADYTQYHDHWVAYTMNELTKYVVDHPEYWSFAMDNITNNIDYINEQNRIAPTVLEMLMAAFETYSRAPDSSILTQEELDTFIELIHERLQWMLDGYFYPEYAMYMQKPQQILGTFMTRNDGFRVRIDDVQHNIGGVNLYQKNYEQLIEKGLLFMAQK